ASPTAPAAGLGPASRDTARLTASTSGAGDSPSPKVNSAHAQTATTAGRLSGSALFRLVDEGLVVLDKCFIHDDGSRSFPHRLVEEEGDGCAGMGVCGPSVRHRSDDRGLPGRGRQET